MPFALSQFAVQTEPRRLFSRSGGGAFVCADDRWILVSRYEFGLSAGGDRAIVAAQLDFTRRCTAYPSPATSLKVVGLFLFPIIIRVFPSMGAPLREGQGHTHHRRVAGHHRGDHGVWRV